MLLSDFGEQHFFCHCLCDFLHTLLKGACLYGCQNNLPIKARPMKKLHYLRCRDSQRFPCHHLFSLSDPAEMASKVKEASEVNEVSGGQRGEGGQRGGGGQRGERPVSPLMTALDADKDGKLSAEEIAGAAEALKSLDKNEDGVIDASEMTPARGQGGGGQGGGGEGGGRGGDPSERINRMMELDTDGNGEISKEEGGDRMSRMFDFMDGDKNGSITREEIEAAMKRRGAGGRQQRGGGGGGGRQGGPDGKPERPAFED